MMKKEDVKITAIYVLSFAGFGGPFDGASGYNAGGGGSYVGGAFAGGAFGGGGRGGRGGQRGGGGGGPPGGINFADFARWAMEMG